MSIADAYIPLYRSERCMEQYMPVSAAEFTEVYQFVIFAARACTTAWSAAPLTMPYWGLRHPVCRHWSNMTMCRSVVIHAHELRIDRVSRGKIVHRRAIRSVVSRRANSSGRKAGK
jgi:hypothetical protein